MELRPFQQDLKDDIYGAWDCGAKNVLAVLPTGGGKTVVFSTIISENAGASVAIAHRQEIISQISMALARNGVRHRVIGSPALARACTSLHLSELKRNYVDASNKVAVAGVDTLVRMNPLDPWFASVSLVVQDEAHHLLRKNKWGRAQEMFINARGLGVTATPIRADGAGLGRARGSGIMDTMIEGPTMRELIDAGWLTDYRIFAPASDIDLEAVPLSASGDFSPLKLADAVHKSQIVGDVVQHYLRIAKGKLGVTFAVDVAAAADIAEAFRAAGVPAEVVSAKTPDVVRASILRKFRNREILQLVNVDLFGEGFDLPAIEVVCMARPTQSYSLFAQQFGRALRPMEGKTCAIVIDHVGNTIRHGLPDAMRVWSLDSRDKAPKNTKPVLPIRTCPGCTSAYEAYRLACPYCDFRPVPASRSSPEAVAGDLYELSKEALAQLRGQIDAPVTLPYSAPEVVINSVKKNHREMIAAHGQLREAMSRWAGRYTQASDTDSVRMLQRRFFAEFGIDVASAQTLTTRMSQELIRRIDNE